MPPRTQDGPKGRALEAQRKEGSQVATGRHTEHPRTGSYPELLETPPQLSFPSVRKCTPRDVSCAVGFRELLFANHGTAACTRGPWLVLPETSIPEDMLVVLGKLILLQGSVPCMYYYSHLVL